MPINIHPISGDFNETVYQFLRKQEGFAPRIYSDSEGIPTLGVGYALAVKGSSGIFVKRSTLTSDLALIGVTLTAADDQLVTAAIAELNAGNIRRSKALIPEFKQGENSSQVNKFSFLLSGPTQFRPLFDVALDEATTALRGKLGVPLFSSLAGSNEMVALLSLTFNNPELIGDDLINALQTGNRVEAWYEIRYRSNGGQSSSQGIANRRYAESDLFGLYNGVNGQFPATELEARQVLAYLHQPNIGEHILRYEGQFKLPPVGAGGLDRYTQPAEGFLIIAKADPLGLPFTVANVVAADPDGLPGDPLVGTEVSDLLLGASGHDILIGSGGDDVLRGEEGKDLYVINSGDGNDVIVDTTADLDGDSQSDGDGLGVVVYDERLLQGGVKNAGESVYRSLDGQVTYAWDGIAGHDLTVTGPGGTLMVKGFTNGQLGLLLKEPPPDNGLPTRTEFTQEIPDPNNPGQTITVPLFDDTSNSYTITGDTNNVVHALGGNDVVVSGVGNDELFGEAGNDSLQAGTGHDVLFGGEGTDTLHGQQGDDVLHGEAGDDTLMADGPNSAGSSYDTAGDGQDWADGGLGADILYGGGDDILLGGVGNDHLWSDDSTFPGFLTPSGNDWLDGGEGVDVLNEEEASRTTLTMSH